MVGFWGDGRTVVPGEKPLVSKQSIFNTVLVSRPSPNRSLWFRMWRHPLSSKTPLVTTIALIRHFRSNDADGKENVKKTVGFISKTTFLHVHHAFVYISLPVLARLRRENTQFRFFLEYVNKQRRNFISLSELELVPRNSTPGGFAYIWQSKWLGIIVIGPERKKIHFFKRHSCYRGIVGS